MMKKITLLATMAALFAVVSCQKEPAAEVPLTVKVTNVEEFNSKGSNDPIGSVEEIKAIKLLFFKQSDHSIAYHTTQIKEANADHFGTFSLTIPGGVYDMVVLGYGNGSTSGATVNSYTSIDFEKPTSVFLTIQTVTVSSMGTSSNNINATLHRINARLVLNATDSVPPGTGSLRISYSASGTSLNPSTGLATSNNGFSYNTSSFRDRVNTSVIINSNILLFSDEQIMNVTIESLDTNNNVVLSHTFENLGFKRNRRTILSGPLFHMNTSTDFTVNTDWITSGDTIFF